MKIATDEFKAAWRANGARVVISFQWKRRFFNESNVLVELPDFEDLDPATWLKEFPAMSKQLDVKFKSVFSVSVVTVMVANLFNEWVEQPGLPSIFAADAVAVNGYFARGTQFRFRLGVVKLDGTTEFIDQFTGELIDIKLKGRSPYAQLTIASPVDKLRNLPLDKISDAFALEDMVPAAGDGIETKFQTQKDAVAEVNQIQVNAIDQNQGVDYDVSKIGSVDPSDVDFRSAPGGGQAVQAAGRQWKRNQQLDDIAKLIYDEAGIGAADRQVDPVILPSIAGSITIDLQAEWEAGTFSDTEAVAGVLRLIRLELLDDFESGLGAWTIVSGAWIIRSFNGSNRLASDSAGTSNVNAIERASTQSEGTWDFIHSYENNAQLNSVPFGAAGFVGAPAGAEFQFMLDGSGDYYAWRIRADSFASTAHTAALIKVISGSETVLGSFAVPGYVATTSFSWHVTRNNSTGEMKVLLGGVLKLTVSDSTITTSVKIKFRANAADNPPLPKTRNYFDDIKTSLEIIPIGQVPAIGSYESVEFDLATAPTAFGKLDRTQAENGGVITHETRVASISGGPFDAYIAISVDGQINSALKRFLQIRTTLTPADVNDVGSAPEVSKLTANFQVTTITISVVNLRGKKGLERLQRYAQVAGHEVGANDSGKHFWRQRSVSPSVISISSDDYIIDVVDWSPGWDRIDNVGEVIYGEYVDRFDAVSAGEAVPTSETQFGRRLRTEDLADLFLANDLQLAKARAETIYNEGFRPKIRLVLKVWQIPWLEIGDVITVSFFDHPIMRASFWGDPLKPWGSKYGSWGDAPNVLARDLQLRVLEYSPDAINARDLAGVTATIIGEEVLS